MIQRSVHFEGLTSQLKKFSKVGAYILYFLCYTYLVKQNDS